MEKKVVKGLTMAIKDYFGYRTGEGLKEFSAELKCLTEKDKSELREMLSAYYEIPENS